MVRRNFVLGIYNVCELKVYIDMRYNSQPIAKNKQTKAKKCFSFFIAYVFQVTG